MKLHETKNAITKKHVLKQKIRCLFTFVTKKNTKSLFCVPTPKMFRGRVSSRLVTKTRQTRWFRLLPRLRLTSQINWGQNNLSLLRLYLMCSDLMKINIQRSYNLGVITLKHAKFLKSVTKKALSKSLLGHFGYPSSCVTKILNFKIFLLFNASSRKFYRRKKSYQVISKAPKKI